MASTAEPIRIHYRRPPDQEQLFVQDLLERRVDCIVTFLRRTPAREPVVIGGRTVLEPGSPIVWFTFPGEWHDIGRFHLANGQFTGLYANILTPVRFIDANTWHTTDLFLDVWADPTGAVSVLDVDELSDAVAAGWIEPASAARGRAEAADLVARAERGEWPPAIISEWTLERARFLAGAE